MRRTLAVAAGLMLTAALATRQAMTDDERATPGSRTSTYDTLLVNTRGGALYTVRVPLSSPMKPVVKVVRTSTWQGFETLNANRCGQYGSLLLGIDKDTKSAHLYAVGHANGTATPAPVVTSTSVAGSRSRA